MARARVGALPRLRRFAEVQSGAVRVAEECELDGAVVHDRVSSVLPKPHAARLKRFDDLYQRLTDVQADLVRPGHSGGGGRQRSWTEGCRPRDSPSPASIIAK